MNKENCALKLVDEIIVNYDARSKKTSKYSGEYYKEAQKCLCSYKELNWRDSLIFRIHCDNFNNMVITLTCRIYTTRASCISEGADK